MTQHIRDELLALRAEAAHLFGARAEELRDASRQKANEVVADVEAVLTDLRDAVNQEEEEIARAVAGRAATALATALALGVVVGWTMRKKS